MEYTTLVPEAREVKDGVEQAIPSLYEVCQQLVDGRAARGKRYALAALLMWLVLAKLAGMKRLLGASEWIEDQNKRLCEHLHLSWKRMPCANTYKYALARLNSHQVNAQLAAWLVRCEAASADVGRSRAVWEPSPESRTAIWLLMAKRSEAPENRGLGERTRRSRSCMSMRCKLAWSCSSLRLLWSTMK